MVKRLSVIFVCFFALAPLVPAEHAEAQVETGLGRIIWAPSCEKILGEGDAPSLDEQEKCIESCVENYDGENHRVYRYYCFENYNEDLCNKAIDRFDTTECEAICCKAKKKNVGNDVAMFNRFFLEVNPAANSPIDAR